MALMLCRSVAVQRQALLRSQSMVEGGVRLCSGPGKELSSNITRREKVASGSSSHERLSRTGLTDHKVNRVERYILVWSGKYKSLADVPALVSQDTIERARNKARIKINLMMMAATLVLCLIMIRSGKLAREAGETVVKMNQDWHKQINEDYKKSLEKKEE